MSNYAKYAVRGAATVFIVSLLAAFLGYLVRFLLVKNLSVENFGLFYSVFSFLGLLGIFKTLGFDKSLIKFIPEFMHEKRNDLIKSSIVYVAITQLITNAIIIILVYLLSNYLSVNFFHSAKAAIVLRLLAIAFFIDNFVFMLKFAFQGFQKMMLFAGIDLVRMVLILAFAFLFFRLNYGVISPVIAYIAAPAILLLVFVPVFIKKIFPEFTSSNYVFSRSLFSRISKYSIFVMATSAGGLILGYTDSLVLTYFSGLEKVGLYNVALPTARVLTFFPMAVMGVMVPLTSELWAKRNKVVLKAGMEMLYKYSIITIMPFALVMFSFAELLLASFFGSIYVSAGNALRILSIGMIFATLYTINYSFFAGIGKPEINTKVVYSAAIFNLIGNLVLIPLIGILGAAITTTIGYLIMMYFGFTKIKDYLDVEFPIKLWLKTFLIVMVFIFTVWLMKKVISLNVWVETAIILATAGIVYVALLFLLNVIDANELKDLYKRIVK